MPNHPLFQPSELSMTTHPTAGRACCRSRCRARLWLVHCGQLLDELHVPEPTERTGGPIRVFRALAVRGWLAKLVQRGFQLSRKLAALHERLCEQLDLPV